MSIGSRIKELRIKKGFTQDQIAELLDMNRANISNYERDYSAPPGEILIKMAEIFQTSVDYILGGVETHRTTRELRDLKKFLEQSEIMFDGIPMTDEDKSRIQGYMESMFWEAKQLNKRKKDT